MNPRRVVRNSIALAYVLLILVGTSPSAAAIETSTIAYLYEAGARFPIAHDAAVDNLALPWYYDAGGTSLGFDATEAWSGSSGHTPDSPGTPSQAQSSSTLVHAVVATADTIAARAQDLQRVATTLSEQVERHTGCSRWSEGLDAYRHAFRESAASHRGYTFIGSDGQLFSRSGVNYLLDDDLIQMPSVANDATGLTSQPSALDAITAFHEDMQARGLDVVFVPIPSRVEVYPESLAPHCPPGRICVSSVDEVPADVNGARS